MERIRVVVIRDGDMWAAQCLEYDIGAQAASVNALMDRLACAIDAERAESEERSGGEAIAGIPKAPKRFRDLRENGAARLELRLRVLDENVQLALCAQDAAMALPVGNRPTLGEYLAWARDRGCSVQWGVNQATRWQSQPGATPAFAGASSPSGGGAMRRARWQSRARRITVGA